jgi:hypothetical protein
MNPERAYIIQLLKERKEANNNFDPNTMRWANLFHINTHVSQLDFETLAASGASFKTDNVEYTDSCLAKRALCYRLSNDYPHRLYQLELHMDTTWLYDGQRLVGITIDTSYSGKGLFDLITKDNE